MQWVSSLWFWRFLSKFHEKSLPANQNEISPVGETVTSDYHTHMSIEETINYKIITIYNNSDNKNDNNDREMGVTLPPT